jgi:hypothetical protein
MLVPPVRLLPSSGGIRVTDCHGYRTLALIPTRRDRRAAQEAQTLTWEDGQEIAKMLAWELTATPPPPPPPQNWVEKLEHEVGVYDGGNLVEVLARTGCAAVGRAAFFATIKARPRQRVVLNKAAWILADTDQPRSRQEPSSEGETETNCHIALRRIREAVERIGLVNAAQSSKIEHEVEALVAALGRLGDELKHRRATDSPPAPQPLYHPITEAQESGGGNDR